METTTRIQITEDVIRPQMLQLRDFRPFKTSDEYLWAMKEDLSDWLLTLYPDLNITPNTFMECLETGVCLCKHANNVRGFYLEWIDQGKKLPKCWGKEWRLPGGEIIFNPNARPETFFSRDNVHNFITWCRKLGIFECLLFESDDLIMRKNEKNVILCLLEVARRGSHFGMATPMLVQFEKEIDRDIAKDTGVDLSSSGEEEESLLEYGPIAQIITNDLRSLDERVRELVERCSCPTQFPMIRVAEGKYRIGNTKVMIYVRILRNHVMVRVGGGWDTLAHYLDKHDPCRCSAGHRATIASRLTMKNDGVSPRMKVEYERRDLSFDGGVTHSPSFTKKPVDLSDSGSEISDEGYKTSDNSKLALDMHNNTSSLNKDSIIKNHGSRKNSIVRTRSMSTDEDRPDSRSTDEDIVLSPPRKDSTCILKSQSTSRVPNNYMRSVSNDRSNTRQETNTITAPRKRFVSGESFHTPATSPKHAPSHPPNVMKTRPQQNHTRSLSASGRADFYGRNLSNASCGPAGGQRFLKPNPQPHRNNVVTPSQHKVSGKNTWNGYGTGPRVRNRPNLFASEIFGSKRQNSDLGMGPNISPTQSHEPGDSGALPDLAACIKRALEFNSDADKISHIEDVIKQYELQRNDSLTAANNESVSLPYINAGSYSAPPKPLNISKRKETGVTRIPKPKFY